MHSVASRCGSLLHALSADACASTDVIAFEGQSSGYGVVPPGSKMTYDSGYYIQHISLTLTAAAKQKGLTGGALDFATQHLAVPLGLPDLYDYDALGEDISSGGGQMVSCRDMARVAQLVLNKGIWKDGNDRPYRLANANFFKEMLQPVFPGTIDAYGKWKPREII